MAFGPVAQKHFLKNMGIEIRLQVSVYTSSSLAKHASLIDEDLETMIKYHIRFVYYRITNLVIQIAHNIMMR